MIIQFDVRAMHVQAICGILESYTPTEEVKEIYAKVEALKAEMDAFNSSVIAPKMKEINELVEKHNKSFTPVDKK